MIWRAKDFLFQFPGRALVMGIINVTPDSFSDGGQFFDSRRAIEHGLELAAQGADLLDIGGESTRPRAEEVAEGEEMRRVLPVIAALREQIPAIPLSIDTQKVAVAREALAAGAAIVNDIAANRTSPEMWRVVAGAEAGYVLMHMQGTPQTMQAHPEYENVAADVGAFFADRLQRVKEAGVPVENVVLDPGIGFGKTMEHNLQLLAALGGFKVYQRPMLLGASRKSFIGRLVGGDVNERLAGSLACAIWAVLKGVQIIRAHDVRETRQALGMIEEIAAIARASELTL